MELLSSENKIIGAWIEENSSVKADDACKRIDWLIANSFDEIATLDWQAIFQDKLDGRFWLLDYPESHMHGGGPPSIECISKEQVDRKVQEHDN